MDSDVETTPPEAEPKPQFRHWQSLSDGFLATLIIVGPTFLFAELWRGEPVVDQGGHLWVYPACVIALGFLVGGAIAGRHRSNSGGAFTQGLLVAAMALALIFLADLVRRLVLGQGVSLGVIGIWAGAAAAALLVGGLGGLYGRRRTIRIRKLRQTDRFF